MFCNVYKAIQIKSKPPYEVFCLYYCLGNSYTVVAHYLDQPCILLIDDSNNHTGSTTTCRTISHTSLLTITVSKQSVTMETKSAN